MSSSQSVTNDGSKIRAASKGLRKSGRGIKDTAKNTGHSSKKIFVFDFLWAAGRKKKKEPEGNKARYRGRAKWQVPPGGLFNLFQFQLTTHTLAHTALTATPESTRQGNGEAAKLILAQLFAVL